MLFPAVNGAYTELFATLSPDITMEMSGTYSMPVISQQFNSETVVLMIDLFSHSMGTCSQDPI